MNARSERGQATVLVIGLSLVAFAIAGLAVDGTRAFLYRRSLQNAADAAAVAAAGELDVDAYYRSGGSRLALDARAAELHAASLLTARELPVRATVEAGADSVAIVLRGSIRTSFLGAVGIDSIPVAVDARAEPFAGDAP